MRSAGAPGELPLVSIVTPSLNQGRFIEAAIRSVQGQDYPRIEHLVIDGASRDQTLEILPRYSPPLRWISQPDPGQTYAINRGFRMASGDILSWLNADDLLLPGSVAAVVDVFRSDRDTMMVYGDGQFIDAGGQRLQPFRFTEPFNLRRLIEVHDYILQPAAFVRREALEAVGYLDESFKWCMDWDLWIRVGRRFRVEYLPMPLAQVRLHSDTKTSRAGFRKLLEMHRIVRCHSRRRLPPVMVIHGAGTLYRMCRRLVGGSRGLGRPAGEEPDRLVRRWTRRLMNRIIETGQLPWDRRPDLALRRLPRASDDLRSAGAAP
jgi:GT2 family glycosyltransferase